MSGWKRRDATHPKSGQMASERYLSSSTDTLPGDSQPVTLTDCEQTRRASARMTRA